MVTRVRLCKCVSTAVYIAKSTWSAFLINTCRFFLHLLLTLFHICILDLAGSVTLKTVFQIVNNKFSNGMLRPTKLHHHRVVRVDWLVFPVYTCIFSKTIAWFLRTKKQFGNQIFFDTKCYIGSDFLYCVLSFDHSAGEILNFYYKSVPSVCESFYETVRLSCFRQPILMPSKSK